MDELSEKAAAFLKNVGEKEQELEKMRVDAILISEDSDTAEAQTALVSHGVVVGSLVRMSAHPTRAKTFTGAHTVSKVPTARISFSYADVTVKGTGLDDVSSNGKSPAPVFSAKVLFVDPTLDYNGLQSIKRRFRHGMDKFGTMVTIKFTQTNPCVEFGNTQVYFSEQFALVAYVRVFSGRRCHIDMSFVVICFLRLKGQYTLHCTKDVFSFTCHVSAST